MSTSLYVDGSPAACRAAARDLVRLVGAVGVTGDALSFTAATLSGSWSGDAGELCHDRVKHLLATADAMSAAVERLATALDELVEALEAARALMRRARAAAARDGIRLVGDEVPDLAAVQAEAEDPVAAHLAWARVSALAEEARAAESAGQNAWLGALALVRDLVPPTPAPRADASDASSDSGDGGLLDGLRDLAPELPDVSVPDLPDLPDLPDIPHVPWDEYPFPGLSGIPMLDGISSGIRQILDDDGTPLLGRLAGGWTVGQATAAGGGLGLAYCVAMSRRSKTLLMPGDALDCGAQGAERGRAGARRLVEVLHGR